MKKLLLMGLIVALNFSYAGAGESSGNLQFQKSGPKEFDEFVDLSTVSYGVYEVLKRDRQVNVEHSKHPADVTYAVIKKNGKVITKFDAFEDNYHPTGNSTEFGLFPFLGRPSKQLLIQQTQWRTWAHFIVDFTPDYHVVFDGPKWGVGRELIYEDVDGDGVYEITQSVSRFMFFGRLSNATSHLVDITFKYDPNTREYLPANKLFPARLLNGVEDQVKQLNQDDEWKFASEVLRILLNYIYSGQKNEGWAFFDREYTLPDKKDLKQQIIAKLADEPVYLFLYQK
jgi:hypothetical protein